MGYYIRRLHGMNHTFESRQAVIDCAEAALRLQLVLAKDALAITDLLQLPEEYLVEDRRVQRARETVRRLG